ncbi:hypothetical protein C41B8_07177 [Salinisphaera hydrothermalis C41B8]|uniref:Uncharacterized protein n=1 Tax=Salinisphaera hydrothermalis (strain C41B8) TaxID=1304275 RepID=A0A084IMX4_SALHC|nr:hypothetical protein C41B8_07177 [Salinisphaera hydrothermalis C41B8]
MYRSLPHQISLVRLACRGAWVVAFAACAFAASAHEPSASPPAGHERSHRGPWPGGATPQTPYYPEIGIDIRPELEHWPSNYRPDGYRLPGYDGKPPGEHICRGAHGSTLSSAGTACPRGEKRPRKGRYLSTDGS